MHQKYLWGAAALILLGAAAAFVVVDYALCHPTSLLARLGVAATFAGLNPNPLSDINPAVMQDEEDDDWETMVPEVSPPTSADAEVIPEIANGETIEPIQVESLPPATVEPPTGTEESEWNGQWQPVAQPPGRDPVDQAPKPMPYADEQTSDVPPSEDRCNALKFLHALSVLRSSLPNNNQVYQQAEEFFLGACGCGCLHWSEYATPEEAPVAPQEQGQRENDQGDESWHHGGAHGCGNRCGSPCCPPSRVIRAEWKSQQDGQDEAAKTNSLQEDPQAKGKKCEELPPPLSQPREIFSFWDNTLKVTKVAADPTSDGVTTPFLTGRLILFGSEEKPVCCNGTVKIALYETRPEKGGPWVKLESWTIDKESLRCTLSKDVAGFWGYSLSLPMPAVSTPSSTRVVVEFATDDGDTFFATSGSMRLNAPETQDGKHPIPDVKPDPVDDRVGPKKPDLGDEEESEELQDPGCHRGCHHRRGHSAPKSCGPPDKCGAKAGESQSAP